MHPSTENLLTFFAYDHLPPDLQAVAMRFHALAHDMANDLDDSTRGAEVVIGLRKLLEAKDCFVRAAMWRE